MILGGQLQAARRHHGQFRHFCDHGAETTVAQGLLAHGQQCFFVAGFDMNDAVGREPRLSQARREQVGPRDAPQHLALRARGDAGGEQTGRGAVDDPVALARHLVQRTQRQPAARQAIVDRGNAEGQHARRAPAAVERLDALAQLSESFGRKLRHDHHH